MGRFFVALALFLGCLVPAGAQVAVHLQLPKQSFLAGESVVATVSITNQSGRELVFQGDGTLPWLDFIVNSSRGVPFTPAARPQFGAVKVPAGQTLARSVDLSKMYALGELGNFAVYAVARLPGQAHGGFQSNRVQFTIAAAKPHWSQVVGVPGTRKNHEYRLVVFRGGMKTELFVQIADAANGRVLRTHQLGETLAVRQPSVSVDQNLTMHVLYLITPSIWGHVKVKPDGTFVGRDLYKTSGAANPSLVQLPDGGIQVAGGIYYDPKQETQERDRARKASDRPDFLTR